MWDEITYPLKNPSVDYEWIRNFDLQRTIIIGLSPHHQCHHGDKSRDANIQFSKCLMVLRDTTKQNV